MSEELWNRCLARLEDELPAQQYSMWIRPLQVVASADGSELVLFARYDHLDFNSGDLEGDYKTDEVRVGVRVRK